MTLWLCYPWGPCDVGHEARYEGDVRTIGARALTEGWPDPVVGGDPERTLPSDMVEEIAGCIGEGDVLVPMSEEAVLPCAYVGLTTNKHDVSAMPWPVAMALSERPIQRRLLDAVGLSPDWSVIALPNRWDVTRLPRSVGGAGVHVPRLPPWRDPPWGSQEARVQGDHYDLQGIVLQEGERDDVRVHWLAAHHVLWAPGPGGVVDRYEHVSNPRERRLYHAGYQAVSALGIPWGPVNVELVVGPDGPRVIEVHGRLGWESDDVEYCDQAALVREVIAACQ